MKSLTRIEKSGRIELRPKLNKSYSYEIYFLGRSVSFSHYNFRVNSNCIFSFVSQQSEKGTFTGVVSFCGDTFSFYKIYSKEVFK